VDESLEELEGMDLEENLKALRLELQADFQEQKSLVQEAIESAGYLCIFLMKFHCNFIEYVWGQVKKYLRNNCDYMFDTLKDSMPIALASVPLQTIRRWEH